MNRSALARGTAVIVVANLAVAIWHLYLVVKLQPATTEADLLRVGGVVVCVSVVGLFLLLWTRLVKVASVLLLLMFAVGLVVGGSEHFFEAGPFNALTMAPGSWALPFRISAWVLPVVEIAGIWTCTRLLRSKS